MEKENATRTSVMKDKNDSFQRLSSSIACMRFPLAVTIIFYHSHTIVSIPDSHFYFKFIYPFSLWLGETGVPAFFFISGLWFFYSKKTYIEKIRNRIKSLLVPYLLWNTIMLTAFLVALLWDCECLGCYWVQGGCAQGSLVKNVSLFRENLYKLFFTPWNDRKAGCIARDFSGYLR